jgi:hypothetical protein
MELMAAAGMDPQQVIKAATSVSAEIIGNNDIGLLAVGKNGDFFAMSRNPLENMANSKEIDRIFKGGNEMARLPLIQSIKVDSTPRITQADRQADAVAQAKAAQEERERRMEHFGKWPLGTSARVRSMAIPTPIRSNVNVVAGPPDRVTVRVAGGSAAELTEFYTKALPRSSWRPATGGCFQRAHPISNKTQQLCLQASAGSIVLNITER